MVLTDHFVVQAGLSFSSLFSNIVIYLIYSIEPVVICSKYEFLVKQSALTVPLRKSGTVFSKILCHRFLR